MRTTLKVAPFLALALVSATVLAGCSGKGSESEEDEGDAVAPPAEADESLGGIEGTVVDDEAVALAGVEVGIPDLELYTATDADGRYSFSLVEPGEYSIFANLIRYEQDAQMVTVAANAIAQIDFQLIPLAPVDAIRYKTTEHIGFMNCGFGLVVLVGTSDCTGDENHNVYFAFDVDPGIQTVIGEMVWEPTAAMAAQSLRLTLWQNTDCTTLCDPEHDYGDERGPSPVYLRADAPFAGAAAEGTTTLEWFVWTPGTSGSPPLPVLVLNQPYTIYETVFYGEPAEDGFSVLDDLEG